MDLAVFKVCFNSTSSTLWKRLPEIARPSIPPRAPPHHRPPGLGKSLENLMIFQNAHVRGIQLASLLSSMAQQIRPINPSMPNIYYVIMQKVGRKRMNEAIKQYMKQPKKTISFVTLFFYFYFSDPYIYHRSLWLINRGVMF